MSGLPCVNTVQTPPSQVAIVAPLITIQYPKVFVFLIPSTGHPISLISGPFVVYRVSTHPRFSFWAPCFFTSYGTYFHMESLCLCHLHLPSVIFIVRLYIGGQIFFKSPFYEGSRCSTCSVVTEAFLQVKKPRNTALAWADGWACGSMGIWMTCYWREERYSSVSLNHNQRIVRSPLHAPLPT